MLSFAITTIFAQIPAGYYDSATGTGATLKTQLYNIIKGHTEFSYDEVWEKLKYTDEDTNNTNNVILLYTGWSYPKTDNGGAVDNWNREHTWAKSHGNFGTADGPGTDLHHLRPTDVTVNSARGNLYFDNGGTEYSDPSRYGYSGTFPTGCYRDGDTWEPRDEVKGDVARMIFYMATRYEGENGEPDLEVVDYIPSDDALPLHAKLSALLEWNLSDPVSNWERRRNNRVYEFQGNRNPYIDHPEWVECVWNNNCAGSVNPPSNLTATGVSVSEIDLSWSLNAANNDVLLAYNTTNTFGTPSGSYTAGSTISGGGTVLYVGTNTSFNHTGLASQNYYYKLWSYDGTDYSSGITAVASPLVGEPSNHVTNFTTLNPGATTIDVSWTDATGTIIPSGYLIKANLSGSAITPPTDGQPEADDTFTKNIASGIQTVTFSGLNSNTSYDFEIFPYTNSGSNIDYKTDGTIPSASGTTTDTPTNCGNETFDGLTTGSSSYLDDSFTGQDGSTWNYTDSRTDQNLGNGAAICVRNGYVESGTIPNGINDITISTQRVYSGGTGNITIKINNNVIGTVPYSDVLQTNTISGINISGDIVLKFETPGNGDRVVIDDIIWTCNGGSANNTLPQFTSLPVTAATSGQTYTYNITATDADGDNLTITAPTKPAWLTFTDNGNGTAVLTGTPSNSDAGDNSVSINVFDGTGSVNQNFTITVTAVNTLPEFTSSPVSSATSGQTYTYNITTTDADGDNLTITAPTKPAWLTFTDNGNGTAVLTGTPSNSDVGDNDVILTVSDDTESVNQNFTITVTAASYVTDKSNNKISIYPNPTKHSVDIISSEKIISVEMKNIIGKTIINKENINSKTYRLNLNNLSKGIYFIEITGITNNKIVKKIIKE